MKPHRPKATKIKPKGITRDIYWFTPQCRCKDCAWCNASGLKRDEALSAHKKDWPLTAIRRDLRAIVLRIRDLTAKPDYAAVGGTTGPLDADSGGYQSVAMRELEDCR